MIAEIFKAVSLAVFGIAPGNYSGITHVADNVYAIVDDKDYTDGFKYVALEIDTVKCRVVGAEMSEPDSMKLRRSMGIGKYRDTEGIAYNKTLGTIFVSGEEDQRILEYTLDGAPTGRELAVPDAFSR